MEKIKAPPVVLAVGAIIVVVALYLIFSKAPTGPVTPPSAPMQESIPSAATPTPQVISPEKPTATPTLPVVKKAPAPKPAPIIQPSIKILTPAEGDAWAINQLHLIAWDNEAGIDGGVYLVNAVTNEMMGWILPSAGPKQTSYSWDTRDVSLTRVGGAKKDVQPGSYLIKITFDGKKPEITSGKFTLAAQGKLEIITYVVRLKNVSITPSPLTVTRGSKIIFLNNDSVKQTISSNSFPSFVLNPTNGTYTLDTSSLAAGTYFYSSDVYTYQAAGTLIVK